MTTATETGAVPAGFVDYLYRRAVCGGAWHRDHGEAIAAGEVFAVIDKLAASPSAETRRIMRVLHFFQFREVQPDLLDFAAAEGLDERTVYRHRNRAAAMVWKYLAAARRSPGLESGATSHAVQV